MQGHTKRSSRGCLRAHWCLASVMVGGLHCSGCSNDCSRLACPAFGEGPSASAITAPLAAGTVATLVLDGEDGVVLLSGGAVRFAAERPECLVTFSAGCTLELEALRFRVDDLTVDTTIGMLAVNDLTLQAETPLSLDIDGAGYVLPEGVPIHTCAEVDGRSDHAERALNQDGYLRIDALTETLSLDGSFPVALHAGKGSCSVIEGTLSFLAAGNGNWEGNDLFEDAGVPDDAGTR